MFRAAVVLFLLRAAPARASDGPLLWQETVFFDAMLQARDRMARQQSDPALLPVMKAIAGQAAQQAENMRQIDAHMKAQEENLRYAFAQEDPSPSLATILSNFDTLGQGSDQIRSNLYYLTARCRIAATQALPDPEMYDAALLILGQIQQLQLELNSLYLAAVASRNLVLENPWATDKFFRQRTESLISSVVRLQDSVFAIYNSGYELAMRSR